MPELHKNIAIIRTLLKRCNLLAYFIFSFISISSYSQTKRIDSLQNIIPSLKGNTKVDALVEYARSIVSINYAKSKKTAQEAYTLAEQLHYGRGQVAAIIAEGANEFSVFHNEEARRLFRKSIALSKRIQTPDLEGYALAYIGLNYQNANQLDSALHYYNQSYELLKDNRNPFYLSFLYLTLADYYGLRGEPEAQFNYLEKCWTIRKKFKFNSFLPYIGTRMASYYVNKGEFFHAHAYLDMSQIAMGSDTISNENMALIFQQRSIVCAREGNTVLAHALSNKARKFYEENAYPLELTHLLIESGEVFGEISNYEAGLKDFFDAQKIAEVHHFEYERIKVQVGSAWIYYDLSDLQTASFYLQTVMKSPSLHQYPKEEASAINLTGLIHLKRKNIDEAMRSLKHSFVIRKKIHDQIGIAAVLYNIGLVFEAQHRFDSALYYHHQSSTLEESSGHALGIATSYERLGALYTQLRQFQKAEEYLRKAEQISRKIKAGANLVDVLKDQRELYRAQGKFEKALVYTTRYESLKDSIFNNTLSNRIASLESINEVERKNNAIILLNKTRQLQENELLIQKSKLRQQWYVTASTILAFTLLGSVTFLVYRNNKRISAHRSQVEEQNLKLKEASEIIEKQNNEIKSRNENLEQEVEKRTKELVEYNHQLEQFAFISSHNLRAPVARILGLGHLLELSGKNETDEQLIKEKLIIAAKEMDRVIRDLSSILEIRDHGSEFLTEIDLAEELELVKINILGEIEQTGARIKTDFSKAPKVNTIRSYLDSILYNVISNAIKYRNPGHPTIIFISSEYRYNFICISIRDNGLGIDLSRYREKLFTIHGRFHNHVEGRGIGLYLVKKTLDAIGGKIEVTSEVNVGTTFSLYFKTASDFRSVGDMRV